MKHVDKTLKNSLEISGNRFWSNKTGKFQRKKNKKSEVTRKGKKRVSGNYKRSLNPKDAI